MPLTARRAAATLCPGIGARPTTRTTPATRARAPATARPHALAEQDPAQERRQHGVEGGEESHGARREILKRHVGGGEVDPVHERARHREVWPAVPQHGERRPHRPGEDDEDHRGHGEAEGERGDGRHVGQAHAHDDVGGAPQEDEAGGHEHALDEPGRHEGYALHWTGEKGTGNGRVDPTRG